MLNNNVLGKALLEKYKSFLEKYKSFRKI